MLFADGELLLLSILVPLWFCLFWFAWCCWAAAAAAAAAAASVAAAFDVEWLC